MIYKIKYYYQTGDSFHTEDAEDILSECSWENLEIAKENLQRIKEHYEYYKAMRKHEQGYFSHKRKPKAPKWHNVKADCTDNWNLLNFKLDNGNEFQFWPPWIGYFETLYSAEIITNSNRMRIEI